MGLFMIAGCGRWGSLRSDVMVFETPDWRRLAETPWTQGGGHGRLLDIQYCRSQDGHRIAFFLGVSTNSPLGAHAPLRGSLLLYDPLERTIEALPNSAIPQQYSDSATSLSKPGFDGGTIRSCLLSAEPRRYGIQFRSRCHPPYGRSVVGYFGLKSLELSAVLSADGKQPEPQPTLFGPGGADQYASGQHYVQLLSLASGDIHFVGRPLRVPMETIPIAPLAATGWIGDDGLIAVVPHDGAWIALIHVADFGVARSRTEIEDRDQ